MTPWVQDFMRRVLPADFVRTDKGVEYIYYVKTAAGPRELRSPTPLTEDSLRVKALRVIVDEQVQE